MAMGMSKIHSHGRPQVQVVPFEAAHAPAFRDLNLDWIEKYFAVEELDRRHLTYPRESFIDTGGAILMAQVDGTVVGCCGLLKHDSQVFEVSKMAVAPSYQGRGIGRVLLAAVISHARAIGARRLEIISSTRLDTALHLYRSIGFVEVPLASDAYARGNIALVFDLNPEARAEKH
jgi:N-acetylglutamate synthase-like GNAT family acetyltransferase